MLLELNANENNTSIDYDIEYFQYFEPTFPVQNIDKTFYEKVLLVSKLNH